MLLFVPTAVAQVQTANESHGVVDDNELFVMGPVKGHVAGIFEYVVVWVSHDVDVAISWLTFFEHSHQCLLCVLAVAGESCGDLPSSQLDGQQMEQRTYLLVHRDIDFDTSLGSSLENLVQTPFLVVKRGSLQKLASVS
jgi:hypothetical protein